jgi:vanillate O-demethylase monooxygenase subunit
MSKPFLRNAWYVAAWSYEIKKELFERTIIGESVLMYRKIDGTAVAMSNACPLPRDRDP